MILRWRIRKRTFIAMNKNWVPSTNCDYSVRIQIIVRCLHSDRPEYHDIPINKGNSLHAVSCIMEKMHVWGMHVSCGTVRYQLARISSSSPHIGKYVWWYYVQIMKFILYFDLYKFGVRGCVNSVPCSVSCGLVHGNRYNVRISA